MTTKSGAGHDAGNDAGDDVARLAAAFARLDAAGTKPTADQISARSNFAERLRRLGRMAEAEAHQRRALDWAPDFGGAHYNLGVLLLATGRAQEASARFADAERLMPHFPAAAVNLSAALRESGDAAGAASAAARALADKTMAGQPAVWANLAAARLDMEQPAQAASALIRALALAPHMAEGWANLAAAWKDAGAEAGAVSALRRALVCGLPDPGGALSQLSQLLRRLCRWDELPEISARLRALAASGGSRRIHPWIFLNEGAGRAAERDVARRYARRYCAGGVGASAPAASAPAASVAALPVASRRLRVGYLSADFQEHATALLLAETLERHDRAAVEIFAYSFGPDDGGPMRRRLTAACEHFIDIRSMSHAAAAQRIRADGVDILVDLKGWTQGARPGILAQRPAPIQAQWLGYPGTMGAPFIDYLFADRTVIPPSHQTDYDERIVYLPGCYQPNDGGRRIDGPAPGRAALGLPEDCFVFCCFNAAYKLNPAVFDVWMGLLRANPRAVLWLLAPGDEAAANLRRAAERRGAAGDRLIFAPRRPQSAYLAQYRAADLFFDTWPVGAHTTAADALWAGLPVLTWEGDAFAGRVAASLLRALGAPELVAQSPDDYANRAQQLMDNPATLTAVGAKIMASRRDSGVFNGAQFARGLEAAYRDLCRRRFSAD